MPPTPTFTQSTFYTNTFLLSICFFTPSAASALSYDAATVDSYDVELYSIVQDERLTLCAEFYQAANAQIPLTAKADHFLYDNVCIEKNGSNWQFVTLKQEQITQASAYSLAYQYDYSSRAAMLSSAGNLDAADTIIDQFLKSFDLDLIATKSPTTRHNTLHERLLSQFTRVLKPLMNINDAHSLRRYHSMGLALFEKGGPTRYSPFA